MNMAMSSKASSSPSGGPSKTLRGDARIARVLVIASLALALGLVGCKKVLNDDDEDESFQLRMVNLIEDSPTVQFIVDTTVVNTAPYLTTSSLSVVRPGSHTIKFAAVRPTSLNSSDTTDPIALDGSFDQSFERGRDYTVFAYGKVNDLHSFVMDEPGDKPAVDDDFVEYQFVNGASNAQSADLFITAPDGQINTPTRLTTLAFGQKSETTKLKLFRRSTVTDANADLILDLTVELRDPTSGTVLFTSPALRFTEKQRVLIALVNSPTTTPSNLKLLSIVEGGGAGAQALSTNTAASARAVHVSPDSTHFDIYADSALATPIAANLAYRDASPYTTVPVGEVNFFALPASSSAVTILFLDEFASAAGVSYSEYAVGAQGSTDFVLLTDERRGVATQSTFRFLNAAPSRSGKDAYDVYVTLPGQVLDFNASTTTTSDDAANFRHGTIALRAASQFGTLKSGTYQVRMAPAGGSTFEFDSAITVQDGSVSTFVLIDDPDTASLELMPVEEALAP